MLIGVSYKVIVFLISHYYKRIGYVTLSFLAIYFFLLVVKGVIQKGYFLPIA